MNSDMAAILELLRSLIPAPTAEEEATLSRLERKYRAGVAARRPVSP